MPEARPPPHASYAPFKHGALALAAVSVEGYNAELEDGDGFVGDRASGRAFRAILEGWRERLREVGEDPLGETPSDELTKSKLDAILRDGHPEAAGVVHAAIEEFARELAAVTRRFLRLEAWKGTERIVVGGGLRASRVGELAIGRAAVMLKAGGRAIDLVPIRHHPDEAGLIGTIHLAPSWVFAGYDGVLAADIGGSNVRAGVVSLGLDRASDLSAASVARRERWRHADEAPKRDEVVEQLAGMLKNLVRAAKKERIALAPFVGVACPGVIEEDGSIARGGQNLPGNWESSRFDLSRSLCEHLPTIGEHATHVVMHNDAVVQGLSEVPFQRDVARWGVLTIGTGLGNAVFTTHAARA
ncbi:MAG: hypothetical protein KF819_40615 [Labilithrix sp.]|nr:hypothetical protein [Labilithrix sp.]